LSQDISRSSITELPPGIVISQYFGYNGGYFVAETLAASKGYWVKANGAGRIVLSSTPVVRKAASSVYSSASMTSFRFYDDQNNHETLFLNAGTGNFSTGHDRGLPPVPPDGAFDVRFASQNYIESFNCSDDSIIRYPISMQTRSYPVSVQWSRNDNDINMSIESAGNHRWSLMGTSGTIVLDKGSTDNLVLVVSQSTSRYEGYALTLNYPNPFNPSTSLLLGIPHNEKVDVRVYDVAGRKIKTVLSRLLTAGGHTVTWDGSTDGGEPAVSGIYFVRMNAGNYSAVRKVVLVK
jgi:FlgD Ig-like domain